MLVNFSKNKSNSIWTTPQLNMHQTLETDNLKTKSSAMHFGSDAAACVLGGGGGVVKDMPSMLLACVIWKF